MKSKILFVFVPILLLSLLLVGFSHAAKKIVKADGAGTVTIALSELSPTVNYFEFSDNGVKIRFFAALGSDKKPRVAFDACDVCGGLLGYTQRGADIECNKCGRVFTIDGIGTKNTGYGCWPSYLPFIIKGDKIIIGAEDLKKGKARFL